MFTADNTTRHVENNCQTSNLRCLQIASCDKQTTCAAVSRTILCLIHTTPKVHEVLDLTFRDLLPSHEQFHASRGKVDGVMWNFRKVCWQVCFCFGSFRPFPAQRRGSGRRADMGWLFVIEGQDDLSIGDFGILWWIVDIYQKIDKIRPWGWTFGYKRRGCVMTTLYGCTEPTRNVGSDGCI